VALIEDEHVIQTLGPGRPHPSLSDRVGARRSEGRADLLDAESLYLPIECRPVTTVAIVDEIVWRLPIPGTGFYDLLRGPIGCWMTRDLDVQDLAAGMMDHEKDIEGSEKDRLDAEEITSPDITGVPLEEFPPTRRRSPVIGSAQVLGDGPGRDSKSQPGEFGLQSPLTPQGVLRGHASDERSEL
jgi:hypothetical protein